jgi:hypothetical protein
VDSFCLFCRSHMFWLVEYPESWIFGNLAVVTCVADLFGYFVLRVVESGQGLKCSQRTL